MCIDKNNLDKCIFDIVASMIGATGIAGIFYIGAITTIQPLIYITLAFGILGLLFLTFTLFCNKEKLCSCVNKSHLFTSSIGAVITSIFALTATNLEIAATSVGLLIGSVAFFLFITLISFISILACKICNKENCCRD